MLFVFRKELKRLKSSMFVGEGGAVFHGSVQTPLVRPEAGNELRYETDFD